MPPPRAQTPPVKAVKADVSRCARSTFTLTFGVEVILPTEIDRDDESASFHLAGPDDWVEAGSCLQGLHLQYELYYGQSFGVDIGIYEQVAKVACYNQSTWCRIWNFMERLWITFSISHAFPVRIRDMVNYESTITANFGINSVGALVKGSKLGNMIIFPKLDFGARHYFGPVLVLEEMPTAEDILETSIQDWIFSLVLPYIPESYLDGSFNTPYMVSDIRHQDKILCEIHEDTLNSNLKSDTEVNVVSTPILPVATSSKFKAKNEKKPEKKGFGLSIPGDRILAGAGRLVSYNSFGERPAEMGIVKVILSSANLPADDDDPMVFINIGLLNDPPLEKLRKLNIGELYTQWTLGDETHVSEHVDISKIKEVNFKDSHAYPLKPCTSMEITATFLDNPFMIELRGVKKPILVENQEAVLFGYDPRDRDFGTAPAPKINETKDEQDIVIAITNIDARSLARGINAFITGEYSLYPPKLSVAPLSREGACTNDINLIRQPLRPHLLVPCSVILKAHMTLEVNMGVVGCKPPKIASCFSRLFCIISDSDSIMEILIRVRKINDELAIIKPGAMLTGFALDTGAKVMLYLEGPRDGNILKIWDMTEEFYPKVKPVFSTSSRYSTRIYPEFLEAIMPFTVLKSHAPLALVLACPAVYARPALPIPARIAALKLGRILQRRYREMPRRCDLPTAAELISFRLELCAPTRTFFSLPGTHDKAGPTSQPANKSNTSPSQCGQVATSSSGTKINWKSKEKET